MYRDKFKHGKEVSALLKPPQAVEKVQLSRAFSRLSGKMDMGDAKCLNAGKSVSYTHLDVYKRQILSCWGIKRTFDGIITPFGMKLGKWS